jgi:PEP-CTERM motif
MALSRCLLAAGAAASVLGAASAHALVVHFDPPLFDFFVHDPSVGSLFVPEDTVEVHPLNIPGSFGYIVGGVTFVGFGEDGETLTFGAGTSSQFQLVSATPLWDVTVLAKNEPQGYEVSFPTLVTDPHQTVVFTNPANGQTVDVNVSLGVPEPAGWALMLIGFGALGAALRGRRRSLAAA